MGCESRVCGYVTSKKRRTPKKYDVLLAQPKGTLKQKALNPEMEGTVCFLQDRLRYSLAPGKTCPLESGLIPGPPWLRCVPSNPAKGPRKSITGTNGLDSPDSKLQVGKAWCFGRRSVMAELQHTDCNMSLTPLPGCPGTTRRSPEWLHPNWQGGGKLEGTSSTKTRLPFLAGAE